MSARVAPFTPAGRLPDGSHVVAGDFFENSGATAALEMVRRIKDYCTISQINNVNVTVIVINSDSRDKSLIISPAAPERTQMVHPNGEFLGEITSFLSALLNTRTARGVYAEKAIRYEQRLFKAEAPNETPGDTKGVVNFWLRDLNVPLPIGWMLSREAAKTMRDQLYLNDSVVHNGESMDEILKRLSPPKPPGQS
jgi:hypothetical protein